jgi:collagen type VII alpha
VKNSIRLFLSGLALFPVAAFAQTVPLTQDSYGVTSPATTNNFGTAATINVGGPNVNAAFVQFDLNTLPGGTGAANIARATLSLYVNKLGAAGTVNVSVANGPWTESGLNGANAPVSAAAVASGVSVSTGAYVYVDATAAVKAWLNGTTNSGFIITPNDGNVNVAFDSKESTTTSHPATLTVTLASSGATGATGAVGITGSIGATGSTGAAGVTGSTGAAGTTGSTGVAGATGSTGAAGATGSTGAAGATGSTGAAGATGSTGAAGTTGSTGAAGTTGSTGAAGTTGSTGAAGTTGSTGAAGATGSTGAAGTTGSTGAAGTTGFTGAAGATGSTGAAGASGSTGLIGATGSTGATGTNGTNGATGATGAIGSNGTNGTNGSNGAAGPAGATGATGATGAVSTIYNEFDSGFSDGNITNSTAWFYSPKDMGSSTNNGATTFAFASSNLAIAPLGCTVSQFAATSVVSLVGGSIGAATLTLMKGTGALPTATSVTCTMGAGGTTLYSSKSCVDNTHTVAVAAGDLLSVRLVEPSQNGSTTTANYFSVHIKCQ